MAGSDFRGKYYTGLERGPLHLPFTPDTDASFDVDDLVFYDTADDTIDECGADPALILGFAKANVAAGVIEVDLRADHKVLVEPISPDVEYGMPTNADLAESHIGGRYGLVKLASGNWAVDLSDTTNTRVIIVGRPQGGRGSGTHVALCHFLSAYLQMGGSAVS